MEPIELHEEITKSTARGQEPHSAQHNSYLAPQKEKNAEIFPVNKGHKCPQHTVIAPGPVRVSEWGV